MIVVDASLVLEILLRTPAGERAEDRLLQERETLHAPHLLDLEILQVLRRFCREKEMDPERASEALSDLSDLPISRYRHDLLLERIWELRHNLTAYDAAYVVLAEVLDAMLLTRDRRLASSSGHSARIELVR